MSIWLPGKIHRAQWLARCCPGCVFNSDPQARRDPRPADGRAAPGGTGHRVTPAQNSPARSLAACRCGGALGSGRLSCRAHGRGKVQLPLQAGPAFCVTQPVIKAAMCCTAAKRKYLHCRMLQVAFSRWIQKKMPQLAGGFGSQRMNCITELSW